MGMATLERLVRRLANILAAVGPAAALATLVAYILALRAHGLWGFFNSAGRVVLFLCLCAISGEPAGGRPHAQSACIRV